MSVIISCKHCNTVFNTKSSLNNHMNTAKYCIKIQEKKMFKCEHCEKILSTKQNLLKHKDSCNKKKKQESKDNELKELKEKFSKELIEKDKIIVKINTQLENYKEQLGKQEQNYKEALEKQEDQIKDLQEKLDKIANKAVDRPTTIVSNKTTNNLNITSSLDLNNLEKIKNTIENKLNVNHVVDGQKGLAKFMVETILKDDDGNLLYVCTDKSRNMFKFKNSDGEINKDPEAKKLISFMVDAGIKIKSVEIAREWYEEDGNIDLMKYGIMVSPQERIMNIEDDSSSFKRELASMTSLN
jgi:hypothetical protein